MDKFKRIQNIVNQQDNFRLVSLLTAGGQQLFTFMVFECPCNKELNFMYGMVSMLVPALTLLLLGYILSKKTWKLMTGMCRRRERPCGWRRVAAAGAVLFQISTCAMAAPFTWVAVALLNGNYVVCAVTGTNSSSFHRHLCGETQYTEQCTKELFMFPCGEASGVPKVYRDQVMLTLKAHSQILGWFLIASLILFNLLLTCLARCCSPISYLQLKFWRAYAEEESSKMDSYTVEHAKELAERNVESFFTMMPPENIKTPSNRDWEKISSLYTFSSRKQYYSTLHRHVESWQEDGRGMMRIASVKSTNSAAVNPAVLSFVDDGNITL